ncbi:MAG: DUF4292 domain-containing protein [Chitinophagales bacterium]
MNRGVFFLVVVLLFIFSCRSSKDISKEIKIEKLSPKALQEALQQNDYDYQSFSARLKIRYKTKEKSQSFTANLRMIKDSIIWANFTSLMGIEVGRVLIQKDSVFILDRMDKVYYERHYDFIEEYLPYRLSLKQVQDILLGKFSFEIQDKAKSKIRNKQHILSFQEDDLSIEIQIEPEHFRFQEVYLEDNLVKRSARFIFDDYVTSDSIDFSSERNIFFSGDKPLETEIKFSRIKWNEPVDFPFFVGSKYEKK